MASSPSGDVAELIIRNPGNNASFTCQCGMDSTLAELQARLQESYDGKPAPSEQVVSS
jgi:hypothetical protein